MWRDGVTAQLRTLEHPAWGPAHCRRLYAMCRQIVADEHLDVDDDVLFAVAWLHDIGTFPAFACEGSDPPACAAKGAERVLAEAGYDGDKVPLIARIIAEHSFVGETRDTPEARVLRDADMLEFLGAVGLVRLLSLVDLEEWVPEPRAAVALAMQFADELPGMLIYGSSRRTAEERVRETREFVEALGAQTHELEIV